MIKETEYSHLFPIAVDVEKGKTYLWCSCGKTAHPPLCDKKNCGDKALCFRAELNEEVYLCNCKHTKDPPWCDGSHAKILLELLKNKQNMNLG